MTYRYNAVVQFIRELVNAGTLKVGDRLPSIRQLSATTGYSTVTIHHGYELLESQGYCEARPRAGFYLIRAPAQHEEFPEEREQSPEPLAIEDLSESLLLSFQSKALSAFGAPYPSDDLYNRTELDMTLRRVLRGRKPTGVDEAEGDPELRLQIAKRTAQRQIATRHQDVIVTGSSMQAFNLCLDAFTEPNDIILVESPSYFPALSAIRRRNLRVVEIYSHPRTGVDPDQFEYIVRNNRIRVALLMGNHHYPTGITYSETAMRKIVVVAQKHNVMIIENDMLGELKYGSGHASSFKQFDTSNNVIQYSSFEYTLAPEYGLGWIIAGKYTKRLLAASYLGGCTSDWRIQRAIAEHLSTRSQDRALRRIRTELAFRMEKGLQILADTLPAECSFSMPIGGFTCWVRAQPRFSSSRAAIALNRKNVGFIPGPVFSAARSFENFFAMNLSFPWTPENEAKVEKIARVIADEKFLV